MSLNVTQSLDVFGPYLVASGEPFGMGWLYQPIGRVAAAFGSLQTEEAMGTWFFIENTAILTQGNPSAENPQNQPGYTNYALNITNNGSPDDTEEYYTVYLVVLSFYYD